MNVNNGSGADLAGEAREKCLQTARSSAVESSGGTTPWTRGAGIAGGVNDVHERKDSSVDEVEENEGRVQIALLQSGHFTIQNGCRTTTTTNAIDVIATFMVSPIRWSFVGSILNYFWKHTNENEKSLIELNDITRRPSTTGILYAFPFWIKMPFERLKIFFFSNTLSSSYLIIFPNLEFLWFFTRITSQLIRKTQLYQFSKKLSFPEKLVHFFKKAKFWTFWEILLVQSPSTANLQ